MTAVGPFTETRTVSVEKTVVVCQPRGMGERSSSDDGNEPSGSSSSLSSSYGGGPSYRPIRRSPTGYPDDIPDEYDSRYRRDIGDHECADERGCHYCLLGC